MTNDELDELEQLVMLDANTSISGKELFALVELARHATGRTHTDTCAYCLRPAVRLCDWLWIEKDGFIHPDNPGTCDKLLCLDHAKCQSGPIFMCGKKGLVLESADFCPHHDSVFRETGEVVSYRNGKLSPYKDPVYRP